jgi:hypothetical protein
MVRLLNATATGTPDGEQGKADARPDLLKPWKNWLESRAPGLVTDGPPTILSAGRLGMTLLRWEPSCRQISTVVK